MSGYVNCVGLALPSKWESAINFKAPAKDDKLGWIDPTAGRGHSFKFASLGTEPLVMRYVRTPFDCFTVSECLTKGRGKLTARIQINKQIWEALNSLDGTFKEFLITHRAKLFSAADAAHIGRDNSAIALKMSKPLAPTNADGPDFNGYITVRINGRANEITALETKESASGRYVSHVEWAPRTQPLLANSTRFSLVFGRNDDGKPLITDTQPISGPVKVGENRVRYVGCGDIHEKGALLLHALIRPAYWSLTPGGGASISLVADYLVFENSLGAGAGAAADALPVYQAPEGFAVMPAAVEDAAPAAPRAAFQSPVPSPLALGDAPAPGAPQKRRITPDTVPPSEQLESALLGAAVAGAASSFSSSSRAMTGGAGGGTNRPFAYTLSDAEMRAELRKKSRKTNATSDATESVTAAYDARAAAEYDAMMAAEHERFRASYNETSVNVENSQGLV